MVNFAESSIREVAAVFLQYGELAATSIFYKVE